MFDVIKTLTETSGICGFEYTAHKPLTDLLSPYCAEVAADVNGSVIGYRPCGKPNAKKVMLEAHMDQIGLMVTSVEDNGFVTFTGVGGVDCKTLLSCEVTICGSQNVFGIIGAKPPHLLTDQKAAPKITDLAIDTGFDTDTLKTLVSVGDVISLKKSPVPLLNGCVAGKTMDNRMGVLSVLGTLEKIKDCALDYDIYAVFAAQEEVSSLGAVTAAYKISPDLAIVLDAGHAKHEGLSTTTATFGLGDGPVITVGGNIDKVLSDRAVLLCKLYHIKHQIEAEPASTGTDAWKIQVSKAGVPSLLLSFPVRYMHTTVEVINTADIEATIHLIEKLVTLGCGI